MKERERRRALLGRAGDRLIGAGPERRMRMQSGGLESQLVLAIRGTPSLLMGLIGHCSRLILLEQRAVLSPRLSVGRFFSSLLLFFLSARELVSLLSCSLDWIGGIFFFQTTWGKVLIPFSTIAYSC